MLGGSSYSSADRRRAAPLERDAALGVLCQPTIVSARRVLVLINSLAPYGAENFVLNHVRFADRSRFELTVAHMGGPTTLRERFVEAGAEVVDLSGGRRRRYSPRTAARLLRELRRRRIDILQTHIAMAGVVGAFVGRAVHGPVIVATEQTTRSSHSRAMRPFCDAAFHLAHAHVYISRAVRSDFEQAFPAVATRSAEIITNGIDTAAIARVAAASRTAVRDELGIGPQTFAFVNVGRLTEQKGQRDAIEALARVRRTWANVELFVVGAGELESELERVAADLGVGAAVHFLGQRLDVHRLLGGFDAYVHPAVFEGLGIAVLEAMAAGLPTIASAVDAIPEYVLDRESGLLVPPRDPAALAAAMERVVADRDEAARLGREGQALVRRDHDIRVAVRAYEALYERLLSPRPAGIKPA